MIDYETFCKIHDCRDRQRLTITQTARALGLDPRTVATWVARSRFEPRRSRPRGSVLSSSAKSRSVVYRRSPLSGSAAKAGVTPKMTASTKPWRTRRNHCGREPKGLPLGALSEFSGMGIVGNFHSSMIASLGGLSCTSDV